MEENKKKKTEEERRKGAPRQMKTLLGKDLREEIGQSRRGRKSHHDDRCVEEEELGDRERKE